MFKRKSTEKRGGPAAMSIPDMRISKELKELKDNGDSGVTAAPVSEGNTQHWLGTLQGPEDTVYSGGVFQIDIELPDQYPFAPPKMKFLTKVWHPNVSSQTGAICLDILKDQWSPALTIRTALQSLQALLSAPVPEDPQDAVVAKMYTDNFAEFERQAKEWTRKYAMEGYVDEEAVGMLVEMGFPRDQVVAALQATGNDQQQALEKLLGGV